MSLFGSQDFDNHELVTFCTDGDTGLRALIAIHNTARGPACGGLRMWAYATEAEALRDALRLSRGMSFKNAMADLPLGGGKAVIIGDPRTEKSPALFRAFGRCVERLGGLYITAEDVGTTPRDLEHVARQTRYVTGLRTGPSPSGDPSPFTALGVFLSIKAALKERFGSDDPAGRRILVQGLGNVGYTLCGYLKAAGSRLLVSDVNRPRVIAAIDAFGAEGVEAADILERDGDVYAPCALGATLDETTASRLRTGIVAGAANNQLAGDHIGRLLLERGILYAPDYIVNSGGIINAAAEVSGLYDEGAVRAKIGQIPILLREIFHRSTIEHRPTNEIADAMARARMCHISGARSPYRRAELSRSDGQTHHRAPDEA